MSETENFKRILAIDYGTKRIGLALSDPLLIFAYAFRTVSNDNKLWNELTGIVREKSVSKIILGFPEKENGKPSAISNDILKFKNQLENKFHIEVILRDERYTSSIAKDLVLLSVTKKSKRRDKGLLDRNAAAVILQDYLDEK